MLITHQRHCLLTCFFYYVNMNRLLLEYQPVTVFNFPSLLKCLLLSLMVPYMMVYSQNNDICSKNPWIITKLIICQILTLHIFCLFCNKSVQYIKSIFINQQVYHHSHNTGMPWFYCVSLLLSSVDNDFFFNWGFGGNPCTESVGAVFLKHLLTRMSLCHICNFLPYFFFFLFRISNFLIIISICYSDKRDYYLLACCFGTPWTVPTKRANLTDQCVFSLTVPLNCCCHFFFSPQGLQRAP